MRMASNIYAFQVLRKLFTMSDGSYTQIIFMKTYSKHAELYSEYL